MKQLLFDDFNYPMAPRVHEDGAVVHDRVAIVADAIFGRYVVVCHAGIGQYRADADIFAVMIRGIMALGDIAVEPRSFIDAQDAVHATDHASNDASNDGPDGTGRPISLTRTSLDSSGDPLSQCAYRKHYDISDEGGSKTTTKIHF
jgi:hypothetical protein